MKKFMCLVLTLILLVIPASNVLAKSPANTSAKSSSVVFAKSPPTVFATSKKGSSSLVLVNTRTYTVDGEEVVEYYYKPKSKVEGKSNLITPSAFLPEEGDFKIDIYKGTLSGKDWFGSKTGYYYDLKYNIFYNAAGFGTSFISQPILSYFAGTAINLIYNGLEGSGTNYTVQRTVNKWGEIYHNGSWVDYYYGTQYEIFWGQLTYVYSADGSVVNSGNFSYTEDKGYWPICVSANHHFRDDNQVYQDAYNSYIANTIYYRDYGGSLFKTINWLGGIDPKY